MTISTLIGYLVGRRQAILDVATTRSAVWLGLVFVISAGFAREYDGEDLLHAPWHLFLPLAASLATSFLLFCLLWLAIGDEGNHAVTSFRSYPSFLGLYWMTAPLAWLYALPVERFLSATESIEANLALLAIVSVWRVVLMTRVIAVLYVAKTWHAFFIVMLFADTVALALIVLTPIPIIQIMGGIRLTESERLVQSTAFLIGIVGALTWLVWLVGTTFARPRMNGASPLADLPRDSRVSLSAWVLGCVSLLVWIPILPTTQAEQQLRHAVESDLRNGRIEAALTTMSKWKAEDFPPHWDPPPRIGYGEQNPPILKVAETVLATETDPWVADIFLLKLQHSIAQPWAHPFWDEMDNDLFGRYLNVLEQLLIDSFFIEEIADNDALKRQLDKDRKRTPEQQARLRVLLGEKDVVDDDQRGLD